MRVNYTGTTKIDLLNDDKRTQIIIDIYDNSNQVGRLTGYFYNLWDFKNNIFEMLAYADDANWDECEILDALTMQEDIKKSLENNLIHGFVTIDRLYVFKDYRNKGYATSVIKNITHILEKMLNIGSDEFVIGLIPNPYKLKKEDKDLDLSLKNISFWDNAKKEDLIKFYSRLGFTQTKSDSAVYYY